MAKFKWYGQNIFNFKSRARDINVDDRVTTGASIEATRFENNVTSSGTITAESGFVGAVNSASQTNITGLGTITTGVWRATSIDTAYTDAKVTSIVAGSGVGVSGATGDVTVSASHTQIKILPHHFMSNEDGGANKSAQFRDDTIIGVRATHNDAELYAFVEIPVGHTATSVTVYGNDTSLDVLVYESDINAGVLTDKTHASGCSVGSACDITDVAADGTNYLVIKVAIANYTNDIVYGGTVTLTAS